MSQHRSDCVPGLCVVSVIFVFLPMLDASFVRWSCAVGECVNHAGNGSLLPVAIYLPRSPHPTQDDRWASTERPQPRQKPGQSA